MSMTTDSSTTSAARTDVGYAYPWDVIGDPSFVDRVHALGLPTVALAAAYHSARAATPQHPRTRFVEARTAALYRPVRPAAWEGRRLAPAAADWVADSDPCGTAAATLAEAGIEVAPWVVLTHATRLAEAHPELAVRNCFDEPYPYALCPRSEEVREYASTLAAESVRGIPCSSVVLEACGQLGVVHGSHHDKTEGAYGEEVQRLLSICCCHACRGAWRERGLDADQVLERLRAAVDAGRGPQGGREAVVAAEVLDTLLEVRHEAADALRHAVVAAAQEAASEPLRIVLHGDPDPWATGPLPGLTSAAPAEVDVVVAQCWAVGEASVEKMRRLTTMLDGRAEAAAYVTVLPPAIEPDFADHVAALVAAGASQAHLYHLGLAGPTGQRLLAETARRTAGHARSRR